jgi:hypothetical protein
MLNVPIYCNLLWSEPTAAQDCPKGDIELGFCPSCGFVTNVAFDPAKLGYSQDYENSLHYSPHFQKYAHSLASSLVERHDLHNKDIVEIGCGKGDFLVSLCEMGRNRGVGFDPSYVPREEHQPFEGQVQFVQDFYSESYKNYQADLICCRHTLEHVADPAELLVPLRAAIGDRRDTAIFFEVPNGLYTFRHMAVWDIIYEHCCYFVPTALERAFTSHGFQVVEQWETFDGQFLCLESRLATDNQTLTQQNSDRVNALGADIETFKTKFHDLVEQWEDRLSKLTAAGQRAVVWGAGSKGVTFLNLLAQQDGIEYVVDLNPRKQGMYVAGTGQKIVPPEFLQDYRPDVVIVVNPIYAGEIRQLLADLGLTPEIQCV